MDYEAHIIKLDNVNLVLLKAKRGYVMCGLLNLDTAEKLGHAACVVSGVSNADDVLNAKIIKCTSKAKKIGIREGLRGEEALELLN
ncbi:MAG: DUF1805 domain-containing protein [Candidatus Altiarchaeota archaeon]|nr:DUF1805 domain-containing protein [Candidatus Altiarchaeota archaeon]